MTASRETFGNKLAFNDPDRKTPIHDDICFWLDEMLRESETARWLFLLGSRKQPQFSAAYLAKVTAAFLEEQPKEEAAYWEQWHPPMPLPTPDIADLKITWEYAIKEDRWVSGFVDLMLEASIPDYLTLHRPTDGNGMLLNADPKWHISRMMKSVGFEVKSSIPSLGEVIRQIRFYEAKRRIPYWIVSPGDTYAKVLAAQGIGYVSYPDGLVWTVKAQS